MKSLRIIKVLQEAEDDGILEVNLFDDDVRSNNIRVIKHRINKTLGDTQAITVDEEGVWKLNKEYWKITPIEFRDIFILYELKRTRSIVFWSMTIALTATLLLGFIIGLNYEFIWLD